MMDRHTNRTDARDTPARSTHGERGLRRLDELDDYKVADGDPDIRGWDLKGADGRKLGKVKELIVDTAAMKARYMDVEVDKKVANAKEDWHVLVPVGQARLDEKHDDVLIDRAPGDNFAGAPAYSGGPVTREHEDRIRQYFGAGAIASGAAAGAGKADDYYGHAMYDDRKFWGGRREGREDNAYLTRSEEEEIVVRKHAVQDSKTVEADLKREKIDVNKQGDANIRDSRR